MMSLRSSQGRNSGERTFLSPGSPLAPLYTLSQKAMVTMCLDSDRDDSGFLGWGRRRGAEPQSQKIGLLF